MAKRKKTATISSELEIEDLEKHIKFIRTMREATIAPVDTMGCHMLADRAADPKTYRFQVLVALMLSSQTKDKVTAEAMEASGKVVVQRV